MATSILFMSVSVDGFIADENDFLGGPDGNRIHEWFAPGGEFADVTGPAREVMDEMGAGGAVQGGYTAQQALAEGVLDELQLAQVPVLLGRGRRLFDVLPREVELEVVKVIDTSEATHLRYRVKGG